MKRINIISETIYKGQQKLVNQGAFINFSDLINDIFACNGLTCACNGNNLQKSDYFIRKSALIYSRKKPGANWTSLEKIVKDVYNCCAGTTLCPSKKEQWWITTDVIRPRKTIETINFTNIIIKVLTCCELLDCCGPVVPPGPPYNFDITANWSLVGSGVTDQITFEDWLTNDLGATSVVISSFDLTGNRLKADIIVNGVTVLNLTNKNVTLVEKIGGFNSSLTQIRLDNNQIVTFNPLIPLPSTVTQIRLNNNQIVTFSPSIALPSSLTQLRLNNNQIVTFNPLVALPSGLLTILLNSNNITTFNPTIALPNSLTFLNLSDNNITTFNPTIALPSSLQTLNLDNNNIVTFNPSIALPNSVKYLYLINNQIITFNPTIALPTNLLELRLDSNNIVTFNPSIILPTGLINLNLSSNQMTTAGYTSSEPWANAQTAFSSTCTTFFPANSNSITGTNLETILLTKNCTIIP
jgi:hypothetical protein